MRDVAAEVRAPTYSADFGAISHVELSDIFEAIFAFVACTNYGSMCEIECFLGAVGGIKAQTRTSIRIHPIKKKRFSSISPTPGAQNRHLYHYCIIFPHRFRYVSFRAVASCSLFFKNVVDAYKKWAIRGSILVTKSLRKISVHKIAIINASHYGMARVSRGGNTNYKNDFSGVLRGRQPPTAAQYRPRRQPLRKEPEMSRFGIFRHKTAENRPKSAKETPKVRIWAKSITLTSLGDFWTPEDHGIELFVSICIIFVPKCSENTP